MKLSVVLATYNEEENIGNCLSSVREIAEEIVIVDGTSKDKTVEIARKYGAKVKITTNKQIFHINKQMAIDMATCDWILQLDADERVSPELAKEIKEKINDKWSPQVRDPDWKLPAGKMINGEPQVNGYWIPRKNWFLGRFLMKGGQYPDYTLRLYKKGKGRLPQKDVHEQAEVEGKVGYLKNPLIHYPYKDFKDYIFKWQRYTDLIASQTKEEMKKKDIFSKILFGLMSLTLKPAYWFLVTYIRHKGFMDLWQGFVFSLFSSLRFPVSFLKYIKRNV